MTLLNGEYSFKSDEDKDYFESTMSTIAIMHRASPTDKQMFVTGLQSINKSVAMIGDSVSDATSLRVATVGMCMGGCDIARDECDLIIKDSDFKSVSNAARWGRNIHDNIKRFLQFQLTVNISLVLCVFLTSASLGASPFTVIQIMWINLIMDAFAALALATEAPHPTKLGPI